MITRFALVLMTAIAVACGGEAPTPAPEVAPAPAAASVTPGDDDGHAHEAPHGGVLVEVGEHFAFLEVVLDADTGSVTAYVLDGEAEKALRIAQPAISLTFETPSSVAKQTLILAATANVLTGETVGDTSEFAAISPALKGQTMFTARVSELTVKGQTFRDLAVAKLK
jgi:hypothetical protein